MNDIIETLRTKKRLVRAYGGYKDGKRYVRYRIGFSIVIDAKAVRNYFAPGILHLRKCKDFDYRKI